MTDDDVHDVQRFYPQIYLACHRAHVRAGSTAWLLSSHDAAILSHLDRIDGVAPSRLARHLGIAASTLSASIKRLTGLGYLERRVAAADRRRHELLLTARGAEAMASASVLDEMRVRLLLKRLATDDRRAALRGLGLLARAARELGGNG